MIRNDGWRRYNIWEHSTALRELYARRCREEEPEMTCHAQAAEILQPLVTAGDSLLDVGCGSGYFYHALRRRNIPVGYTGIDATAVLVEIGQRCLPAYGLPPHHLRTMRIEDLDGEADHVVCINVLSNLDNYHRPLERLLNVARKTLILRESCDTVGSYTYVPDQFLDTGVRLKVHVNTYPLKELIGFIEDHGFHVSQVRDRRTSDGPEEVIGYPHYWKFFLCTRRISQIYGDRR